MFLRLTHRASIAQRVWALLLAIVVLGSQLAALAHVAAVRHQQCAEHSEWLEVEGAPALASDDSAELRYHSVGASDGPATAHGHDHCPFAPVGRDRSALRVTSYHSSIVFLSAPLPVAAIDRVVAARGIPLLLLAPKGSPPALTALSA